MYGDDQRMPVARLSEDGEEFLDVGAQPFLGGVACALVGELPAVWGKADPLGHCADGLTELLQVVRLLVCDCFGQAVGRHQHGDFIAFGCGALVQGIAYPASEGIDEGRHGMPCASNTHRELGRHCLPRLFQGTVVAPHDVGRVLGGEYDAHDLGHALGDQLPKAFLNEGRGVAHADADCETLLLRGLTGSRLSPG